MPRRQFVADLATAVEGTSIAGISDVQPGGDDGEFTFVCVADGNSIKISALVPGKCHARQFRKLLARPSLPLAIVLTLL